MHLNHFLSVKYIFVSGLSPNRGSLNLLYPNCLRPKHIAPQCERKEAAQTPLSAFLGYSLQPWPLEAQVKRENPTLQFPCPCSSPWQSSVVSIWQTMGPACLWWCLCICVWVIWLCEYQRSMLGVLLNSFWDGISHWNWSSVTHWTVWLANPRLAIAVSPLPQLGDYTVGPALMSGLGSNSVLMLAQLTLYQLSHPCPQLPSCLFYS